MTRDEFSALIANYLADDLDPGLKVEFERMASMEPSAKSELARAREMMEALNGYALKQQMMEFHEKRFGNLTKDIDV